MTSSVIVTGGHTDLPFVISYLQTRTWDQVIAADSGLHPCLAADISPDVILGDFDSVDSADLRRMEEQYPERIHRFPAEKDETDTELAVSYALESGAEHITILGGTGSRVDHMLGTLQMLRKALDAGAACELVDPHNRVRVVKEGLTLRRKEQFGDYVSLIPATSRVEGLTLTGFAYEVRDFTLESGTARGISNVIRDETATIAFRSGLLWVIESKD